MRHSENVIMLSLVAQGLKELKERVVFVGGATIDLYIADPFAATSRGTDDVDCAVELAGLGDYHEFEERLRALGFRNDSSSPVICRWIFNGIRVDVMPSDGKILGFSNRWYPDGIANAEKITLSDGQVIRVFTVPYLLASKLEAFHNRGKDDFQQSSDIEDIFSVLDGCPDALEGIRNAPQSVKTSLRDQFASLLKRDRFVESIPGHIPEVGSQKRAAHVLELLKQLSTLA